MKILHTSDWHLGKRLDNFSRHEEQVAVLNEICTIADTEKADAIIIAGDLFDTFNPPTDAVELFYKTLKKLSNNATRPVICIAGNHDSPDRIEAPDPLARENGIIFTGYPNSLVPEFELESGLKVLKSNEGFIELKIPNITYPLRLILTPYANELRIKTYLGIEDTEQELRDLLQQKWNETAEKYCDTTGVNILATHLFVTKKGTEIQEEPDDEKPILHIGGAQAIYSDNFPKQIQYVALGHLHRQQTVDTQPCPIVYSGSPLSYSFGESNQKKYVMLIDAEPEKNAKVREIELFAGKKLIRIKCHGVDDALLCLQQNKEHLVELTLLTDNYLNAADKKALHNAHEGIISIIPEVTKANSDDTKKGRTIDLTKNREALFKEYFLHSKGQEVSNELLDLFKEIVAEDN
ncbi:MAG: exonuclease subunit SbcD [Salinivirgaceae bacterium]|nr:exonuclease subunit SbcD [Salinivirgaceae bacterium]